MNHAAQSYRITPLQIQPQHPAWDEWEALAVAEDLRYEVLELTAPPALNEEETARSYIQWYLKGGRVTSVHGAFIDINPASGDIELRSLFRKRCHESCALAIRLGAENIVFHSSCSTFLRGGYLDFWAGCCAEFYEELAETYDLNLFIENSQDIDAKPLMELMSRIRHPKVNVCLDLGHAHYSHLPLEGWFDCLQERIGYLHLSDNRGDYDSHLPLGQGTINWEKADRLWRALGKSMPVTLETGSPSQTASSIAFLKEHQYFAIPGKQTQP